jgi:hypothetical protein
MRKTKALRYKRLSSWSPNYQSQSLPLSHQKALPLKHPTQNPLSTKGKFSSLCSNFIILIIYETAIYDNEFLPMPTFPFLFNFIQPSSKAIYSKGKSIIYPYGVSEQVISPKKQEIMQKI